MRADRLSARDERAAEHAARVRESQTLKVEGLTITVDRSDQDGRLVVFIDTPDLTPPDCDSDDVPLIRVRINDDLVWGRRASDH
jgi:hypothetical protein